MVCGLFGFRPFWTPFLIDTSSGEIFVEWLSFLKCVYLYNIEALILLFMGNSQNVIFFSLVNLAFDSKFTDTCLDTDTSNNNHSEYKISPRKEDNEVISKSRMGPK